MEKKPGRFSQNLLSLKLQLDTLFEDLGGEQVTGLLDSLGALTQSERSVAINLMKNVCERLATSENRTFTRSEAKMKELEDHLVDEIVRELQENPSKLSLVHGGKDEENAKAKKKIATLEKPKKKESKILEFKPVLN